MSLTLDLKQFQSYVKGKIAGKDFRYLVAWRGFMEGGWTHSCVPSKSEFPSSEDPKYY